MVYRRSCRWRWRSSRCSFSRRSRRRIRSMNAITTIASEQTPTCGGEPQRPAAAGISAGSNHDAIAPPLHLVAWWHRLRVEPSCDASGQREAGVRSSQAANIGATTTFSALPRGPRRLQCPDATDARMPGAPSGGSGGRRFRGCRCARAAVRRARGLRKFSTPWVVVFRRSITPTYGGLRFFRRSGVIMKNEPRLAVPGLSR